MLIYNIKTQVRFDLGYNPLIFNGVRGKLLKKKHLAGASVSYGHISSLLYLKCCLFSLKFFLIIVNIYGILK